MPPKSTLPATFYRSEETFAQVKEKILVPSWQFIGDQQTISQTASGKSGNLFYPFTLLPGSLNEPLLLIASASSNSSTSAASSTSSSSSSSSAESGPDSNFTLQLHSNVCTHRGALLLEEPCRAQAINCPYHGRRFNADGMCLSAPGFEKSETFPALSDNLPALPLENFAHLLFTSLAPEFSFAALSQDMVERTSFLPLDQMTFRQDLSRVFFVEANWALYCDNYLEGLHVPFVHPSLAILLDLKSYRTQLHPYSNLQIGIASSPEDAFTLPPEHPNHGELVAAFYYWLFPNMMFNFYPWGLSINVVEPQSHNQTRIRFLTYVYNPKAFGNYNTADIHETEMEDEAIVHKVQKGIQSRLYKSGTYSPSWETGLAQFHDLIRERINL